MTHPTWELPVDGNGAALVLMPCPGTQGTSMADSLNQLKNQGVSVIVTALSLEELQKHDLAQLPEEIQKAGIKWVHAPIVDDHAPTEEFLEIWRKGSPLMHEALAKGEKVAMHCMGGSGRTGLLAAHLLLEKDWVIDDIFDAVKKLRPTAFSKAPQLNYILTFISDNFAQDVDDV